MKRRFFIQAFSAVLSLTVGWLVLENIIIFPASQAIDETIFPQSAHSYQPGTTVVEPYKKHDRSRHVHHLKQGLTVPPDISIVEFREESDSLPSADDPFTVATVVDKLHSKFECNELALSIPLHWKTPSQHGAEALSLSLEQYQTVYFSSELTYRAESTDLPFYICKIHPAHVSGSPALLPKVNAETLPPSLLPPNNTLAGFSSTTSVANSNQLLLQWGEHIIPSFSLLQLLISEGISLEDITVMLGRCIIFGDKGPILPIDKFGSYAGNGALKTNTPLAADSPWSKDTDFSHKIFLSSDPDRTEDDMSLFHQLIKAPRTDFLTSYYRLETWAELIVLADVAILFAWFLGFRPLKRHICFLLVLVTLWPVLVSLSSMRNMWTPASAVFATAITGWITSFVLAPLVQRPIEDNDSLEDNETANLT